MADERPGVFDAAAAAVGGAAFAIVALVLRSRTLLPAGFFDGVAAASLALGLSFAAHRWLGAPAASLARGIGLASGAVLVCAALVAPFDRAALPLAAWILGGALLQAGARAERNALVLTSLGVILLGAGCVAAYALAPGFPEAARLRLAVAAAGALWALGLALRAATRRSRFARWAPAPLGILLVVAVGCVYVAYRPLVATRLANLPLYEWTLGVSVALLLLGRMRRQARDAAVPEAWESESRRHAQRAQASHDPRMAPLAAALERYLDRGEGFEEYAAALRRVAPGAPEPYRKALQGLAPVQGRGRGRDAAARRRRAHDELMALLTTETAHGHA